MVNVCSRKGARRARLEGVLAAGFGANKQERACHMSIGLGSGMTSRSNYSPAQPPVARETSGSFQLLQRLALACLNGKSNSKTSGTEIKIQVEKREALGSRAFSVYVHNCTCTCNDQTYLFAG